MSRDLVVYRSTHPDVLAAWDKAIGARKTNGAALLDYARSLDPEHQRAPLGRSGFGSVSVIGFEHNDDWPVPKGWRISTKPGTDHIVPDQRTKAGKVALAALRTLSPGDQLSVLYKLGLPQPFLGDHRFYTPGAQMMHGALYVTWSKDPLEPHDPVKWEPVKLSDYYAAVEAEEATSAAPS